MSRNGALGKSEEASVRYVCALRGESLKKVGADLHKAGVVSDREIGYRRGLATPALRANTNRNVHSGQSGATYGACGGYLLRANGYVRQKANNKGGPDDEDIARAARGLYSSIEVPSAVGIRSR